MAFGIKFFESDGSTTYSTADATFNLITSFTVPANSVGGVGVSPGSYPVAIYPERIVSRLMLGQLVGDDEAFVHEYTLSSTSSTLYVTLNSAAGTTDTVATQFLVFGR